MLQGHSSSLLCLLYKQVKFIMAKKCLICASVCVCVHNNRSHSLLCCLLIIEICIFFDCLGVCLKSPHAQRIYRIGICNWESISSTDREVDMERARAIGTVWARATIARNYSYRKVLHSTRIIWKYFDI